MIVLAVRLEMFGEIGDAFGQDRDLDLWRSGVAGFGRVFFDKLLLALSADRHRKIPCGLRVYHGRAGMSSSTVGSRRRRADRPTRTGAIKGLSAARPAEFRRVALPLPLPSGERAPRRKPQRVRGPR